MGHNKIIPDLIKNNSYLSLTELFARNKGVFWKRFNENFSK